MKLKKEFLCHTTDQEAMLVPTGRAGFAGLVRGNKTLGIILNLLEKETTEAEIVAAMKARFDAPEEVLHTCQLLQFRAVVEDLPHSEDMGHVLEGHGIG